VKRCLYLLYFLFLFSFCSYAQSLNLQHAVANCVASGAALQANHRILSNKKNILELRGDFSSAHSPSRASWDFPLRLNLSQMSAVKLRLRISGGAAVRQYNLYINTGDSWYAAKFTPTTEQQWEEIIISKTSFLPETNPQSWQSCALIRLAAWKGSNTRIQIQLAAIEFLQPNLSLGLLRGGNTPKEVKDSYFYAKLLGRALTEKGIYPAVFESGDCTARILYPYNLLLLPYPTALTPGQINAVRNYLHSGRSIGAFYTLPPLLAAAFQQPTGKFMRSSSLSSPIAAVQPVSSLLPNARTFHQRSQAFVAVSPTSQTRVLAWWLNSKGRNTNLPAILQGPKGFWMTHIYLNQDSANGGETLLSLLEQYIPSAAQNGAATILNNVRFNLANQPRNANKIRPKLRLAEQAYHSQSFRSAATLALQCKSLLQQGVQLQEKSAPSHEFRAIWSRNTTGLPGKSWEQTAASLSQSGINALFPNFATSYSCSYNSDILPNNSGKDRLQECLIASHHHEIRLHVWLSCFGVQDAPPSWLETMRQEGRLAVDSQGKAQKWLCPNQYANQHHLLNIIQEIVRKYPIDGLHLDLIRFAGSTTCFCPACRNNFQNFVHRTDIRWPQDVQPGGPLYASWQEFRCQIISDFIVQVRQICRRIRPKVFLSAAVYPDLEQSRASVGQDWGNWIFRQNVDFVCPMNYVSTTKAFQDLLTRQHSYSSRVVPGIGVTVNHLNQDTVRQQILATRHRSTPGFILFELSPYLQLNQLLK